MRFLARMPLAAVVMLVMLPRMAVAGSIYALLIGVTEYPNLDGKSQLRGPMQDVKMFRELLTSKPFVVPDKNVFTLAANETPERQPTAENIRREYRAMIERVTVGDQVVILQSGHGSQLLDDDPDNPDDREPDGMDEVFVAADVVGWRGSGEIANVIRDDEIRLWLNAIRDKGAAVFFVSDSCHSDTQTRGSMNDDVRTRSIELIPRDVRDSLPRTSTTRGDSVAAESTIEPVTRQGIVAFYAARSNEETPDHFRDPKTRKGIDAGLLTFTICEILKSAQQPITYRELGQQIRSKYNGYHRDPINANVPTPMMEGNDLDREVLGNNWQFGRSNILYSRKGRNVYLTCTRLDGVLPGSILKLYPLASEANAGTSVGWARVTESNLEECVAVAIEYDPATARVSNLDDANALPVRGRCEVFAASFGELRIPIHVDASVESPEVHAAINKLAEGDKAYLEIVPAHDASFRLMLNPTSHHLELERTNAQSQPKMISRFDLGAVDKFMEERLTTAFKRILRVQALRETAFEMHTASLANKPEQDSLDVEVTIEVHDSITSREPMTSFSTASQTNVAQPPELPQHKFARFRFENKSRSRVRVSAFYLGDDFGIVPIFPLYDGGDNLLGANGETTAIHATSLMPIENATRATEDLIVITTPDTADGDPNYGFSFIEQGPLPAIWLASARGSAERDRSESSADRLLATSGKSVEAPKSPLASLLEEDFFSPGGTRAGFGSPEVPKCSMRIISWNVASSKSIADVTTDDAEIMNALRSIYHQRATDPWVPEAAQSISRGLGATVYPQVAPAVVVVRTNSGHGTGFFISDDGWILTNHHVVEDCQVDPDTGLYEVQIHYGTMDGSWMKPADEAITADVYRWSEEKDLALLKIRNLPAGMKNVPYLKLAANPAGPGEDCVAIGHPASGVLWTLRTGQVSGAAVWPRDEIDTVISEMSVDGADRQQLRQQIESLPQRQVLLSSCGLNPGDSGGPLVNKNGELLAVSFAIPLLDLDRNVSLDKFSYHVNLPEVEEFIANKPARPMQWEPDAWARANKYRLTDFNSDSQIDLLVLLDSYQETTALLFDLNGDSTQLDTTDAQSLDELKGGWDCEVAMLMAETPTLLYDTNDDGVFDLWLADLDQDGNADQVKRLEKGRWILQSEEDAAVSILSIDHFESTVAAECSPTFTDMLSYLGFEIDAEQSNVDSTSTYDKTPSSEADELDNDSSEMPRLNKMQNPTPQP